MSVRTDVTGSGAGSIEVVGEVVGEIVVGVTGVVVDGTSATDKLPNIDEVGMAELLIEGVGVATMAEVASVDGLAIRILVLEVIVVDVIAVELELNDLEVGLLDPGNGNSASNEANQAGT